VPIRISVRRGRSSRLKRFLSMPKKLGASRRRIKRGCGRQVDGGGSRVSACPVLAARRPRGTGADEGGSTESMLSNLRMDVWSNSFVSPEASFHRCHIVPEAPRCVCLGFERVCAKTRGAPMTISHLAVGLSLFWLRGTSFRRNSAETSTAANAGSRSSGRRERAHPTAKLLRV